MTQQTSDILDKDYFRFQLPHRTEEFWKHIPLVEASVMFAAQGERLARRPTGQEVNLTFERCEIETALILNLVAALRLAK